jgi:Right handed beta helix region
MIGMRTIVGVAMLMTGLMPASAKSLTPPSADFYVSINGNDTWSGRLAQPTPEKTDGPFRTLERARDAVRRLKPVAGGPAKSVTVAIRGGVYTFDQTFTLDERDSGTATAPVFYQAFKGEKVILAGGPSVPPEAFTPVIDAKVLERLDPAARTQILRADLRALGITDLGDFPVKYQGAPAVPELFFDGRRMTLARWPNQDWTTIAKIIDPGAHPRIGDKGTNGGVFEYAGDRPSRWSADAGVWLHGYWCYDWYSEVIRVEGIDRKQRRITLAAPSVYSIKQGNPSPRRYYALNLLEELDRPGEYFIDRNAGRLYFWPPAPMESARVVLSTLKAPVVAVKDATGVVLSGFVVEASLANGIEVSGGSSVRIQACEVRNTREIGITVSGGTGHTIEACDIHDTGTGGMVLSGGDRKRLTPAGHEAINNHIWRFSRLKLTSSYALRLEGVGNRGAHNLIHDAPHQAIGIGGNDHIFEYNEVHHVCMATDDCGAYYKGRNPSCRGNVVRYNFWHDIGSPMGHGNAAIYFDDGDGGDTVFGNVFFRCGEPGKGSFGTVFSHGGHDNVAENNIFIECKRALGSAPWNDARWKRAIDGGEDCFWQDKLLKDVDITKPPYTTRYPALVGYMDPKPGQVRVNKAMRNVFVDCAEVSSGNWQIPPQENWITDRDPGFVNMAMDDFQLKPDSEVFSKLPGFQPIPFEKIGLIQGTLRPTTSGATRSQ